MRKYFMELFAIGWVDSNGKICEEQMSDDALMTAIKTMEELERMKLDRLVLETTMDMLLCLFDTHTPETFTEVMGNLLGGKYVSKVTAHLEALEELLTEEEYRDFLTEYLGYLTVKVADYVKSLIIDNTTNAIESLNSTYRKLNRQRSVFPSDTALLKALYLATFEATKKWTSTIRNWGAVYGELSIMYEGRLPE